MTTKTQMNFINETNKFIEEFFMEADDDENLLDKWRSEEIQKQFKNLLKKKKVKKVKDPNKPKKNKSSYLFFCAKNRPQVKEDLGDAKATEVTSELGKRWQELKALCKKEQSDDSCHKIETKKFQKFEKLAVKDKNRYLKEMENYDPPSDEELEEMSKKKKKKKKKKIDSDKPKRGKSAYLYFCSEIRPQVKEDLGDDAEARDVTSEIAKRWKQLKLDESREEELEAYQKLAMEDSERYASDLEKYESSMSDSDDSTTIIPDEEEIVEEIIEDDDDDSKKKKKKERKKAKKAKKEKKKKKKTVE